MIEHIVHLGFEVRVELVLAEGENLWAQITQAEAEQLELEKGQIVYVRPSRARVFDRDGGLGTSDGSRRPRSCAGGLSRPAGRASCPSP